MENNGGRHQHGTWMQGPITLLHLIIAVLGLAVIILIPTITSLINGSERITRIEQDQVYNKKINESQDQQLSVLASAISAMQITVAAFQVKLDFISTQLALTNRLLESRAK